MNPYIAELRRMHAQVETIMSQLERDHPSPARASPSRDALSIPSPGRSGVGDSNLEKNA
jgi:hypothetical protein